MMPVLLFLVIFFFSAVPARAQSAFDGPHGTHHWIEFSDAPNALYHTIAGEAYADLSRRSSTVAAIHTRAGWKARQQWVRGMLRSAVGPFPARTPLNALVTGTFDGDGYRLKNIRFESQPGYYVTAGLFLPANAGASGSRPGVRPDGVRRDPAEGRRAPVIVYCSGHSDNGYRMPGYLNEILNFVRKGFIVFAFDPMGQGERLQYYDTATGKSRFRYPAYEHSYCGAQLFITGNTLARDFIWDGIRAIDYLCTRPEVDTARIGITGRSGGGTQSAMIAAFDGRIKAAAPENYITNMRRLFEAMGPQDAEQDLMYALTKGWDMADLLSVRAPKPTLVITTSQDMFPIQGALETCAEVGRVYRAFGASANFRMVTDDAPHASTLKNREATYAFFQRVLDNPGDSLEVRVSSPRPEALRVTTTGQVSTSLRGETAFSLNAKDVSRRLSALAAKRRRALSAAGGRSFSTAGRGGREYLARVLQSAKLLSGYREPAGTSRAAAGSGPVSDVGPWFVGRAQRPGYVIEKYLLKGEGDYRMPYLVLKPVAPVRKAVIYLNSRGKAADLDSEMEVLVRNGAEVVAPDLVGIGELGPGVFQGDSYIDSVSYNLWFAAMMVGRSIVGIQAGDVVRIVNQLERERIPEIYGYAKGRLAPVLLHAAAFDTAIRKVALDRPYVSYEAIATDSNYSPSLLYGTVAGAIGVYDLDDLAASLAPRPLLIGGDAGELKQWLEK